jgi:hypothetical protein
VRVLAYVGALAVLAVAAASFFRTGTGIAAIDLSPQPQWINVDRPHPAFELLMPELAGSPTNYAIMRRASDGARKDVLTFGEAAGGGPYVMVEIYRPGVSGEPFLDAPSEVAARIVQFAVTDDVKAAGRLDSKFGAVPLVDFAIAARGKDNSMDVDKERRCLGFARPFDEPAMQISGWYCSGGKEVVDRATLACALDRLTILSAGGDRKLDALFAHAELKRTFCGQRNPILAATPEHEEKLAAAPHGVKLRGVKLRGRISLRDNRYSASRQAAVRNP